MNKSDTITIIRSLLSSTNTSYSVSNLNRDFKKETGIDIPLFGYGSISDFLNSIPDTVKVTGIYPIQKVSLVTNDKSGHIVSLVKRQKNNAPKNKFFQPRKSVYKNTSFRIERVKEPQIEENHKEVTKKTQKKVFDDLKDKEYKKMYISMEISSFTNERIPILEVTDVIQIGQYIEVCPCWIIRPDKFYFRFRKFNKKFHNYAEKLQMFYMTYEEIPFIPTEEIRINQSCVVFYNIFSKPAWHRAEIKEINKFDVVVKLVDYGNTAEIPKENLKYLYKGFLSFPQQAILGFLANIKPLNNQSQWSHRCIKKFYDLAFEKDLIGGVVHVNDKDNSLGLALSFTRNSEIHINDTLVKEGFAEFDINVSDSDGQNIPEKDDIENNGQNRVYFCANDNNNTRLRKMFFDA